MIHILVRRLAVYALAVEITSADADVFAFLRYQCIGATERKKLSLVSPGSSTLVFTLASKPLDVNNF